MAKTYLFQPQKKVLKQGFFMTDENGTIVYEANMLTQPLIGAMKFEFVNHLTNQTIPHKVSKTSTTETSGPMSFATMNRKSWFKLDDQKVWDYLHEQGIRIDSSLSGGKIGMSYDITLKGQPLAKAVSTTLGGKSPMTSPFVYDVTTEEKDLDMAFLVVFAIARTEQTFYS